MCDVQELERIIVDLQGNGATIPSIPQDSLRTRPRPTRMDDAIDTLTRLVSEYHPLHA